MKLSLCALIFSAQIAHAGLEKYSDLLMVGGGGIVHGVVGRGVLRVTYLGVNGYRFESANHVLLVDPYFTRVGFWAAAFNQPIASDERKVDEGFNQILRDVDAILVTHGHFDHLMDVPDLMHRSGANLFSGPTAIRLVESLGVPPKACKTVQPGDIWKLGPWRIRVFAAQHDRLFGKVPFNKCPAPTRSEKVPMKASDWCVGEPLAFVIEAAGKRIYIDSGGVPGAPPDPRIKDVDLAILGVALPDSRDRFTEAVKQLRPRYILPSHQDDMFAPLSRGFAFGKMTNFPALVREHGREKLSGRLILLDYFRPWTLR